MATRSTPAPEPDAITSTADDVPATTVAPDGRRRVDAYDKKSGQKLSHPVPRTWLDGRFANLTETPRSKKAGN